MNPPLPQGTVGTTGLGASPVVWLSAAGIAVVLAAGWAFMPLEPLPPLEQTPPDGTPSHPDAVPDSTLVALDRAAFRTPLWVAPTPPPAPPPAPPPPAPPPPLKLQLLAIITDSDAAERGRTVYRAMVYDPDTDKVLVVAPGERLGTRTVDSIDQLAVRLSDERGTRTLTLKSQGVP